MTESISKRLPKPHSESSDHRDHLDSHSSALHEMVREYAGHERHASHSAAMLRDRFWWSLAFSIPVVIWSDDIQHWLGYTTPSFPGSKWIPPVFGRSEERRGGEECRSRWSPA